MHQTKNSEHKLNTHYANRLHVFNNIASAIDPPLTKPALTIMYNSTKTKQRQFQKYGGHFPERP